MDGSLLGADVYDLAVDPLEQHPIPYGLIDQPEELGEAFASAWNDFRLVQPGAAATGPLPATKGSQAGG